jgi:hypothetical protein
VSPLYVYPEASCATFRAVVTDEDGRTVEVHPVTQIVRPMVPWVTEGLIAPGVRVELGRTAPAALTVIPPVLSATAGIDVTATVEEALVVGVLTAAGVGGDETVLDDDVGLSRDEVAGPLEAEPQADSSRTAASTVVSDLMTFFMFPIRLEWDPCLVSRE